MATNLQIKRAASPEEMEEAFSIRRKVFVDEQKVPTADEFDEFEAESRHYIAFLDGKAVGAARWRMKGKAIKLERFAVLKEARGQKIGAALVQEVIAEAEKEMGAGHPMMLHAQLAAVPLYERAGFSKEGDIFLECDIAHYLMKRGDWK